MRRLTIFAFLLLRCTEVFAADVTLAWDANTETDLAGYKVYYGTASGIYGVPISLGKQTTYIVTGLGPGTYFFAVTAYNTSGLESGFSNEVSTTVSSPLICDVNGDGSVNIMDLQALINSILGVNPLPAGRGDVNKDGQVNILDVQVLVNVILGITECIK